MVNGDDASDEISCIPYWPMNSSGRSPKMSSLCIDTFEGNHSDGGVWLRLTSNPSRRADGSIVSERSSSQIPVPVPMSATLGLAHLGKARGWTKKP